MLMKKLPLFLLLLFAITAMLLGQKSTIDGHWLGTLDLPTAKLRLAVTISGSGGDEIKAVLTSLDQGMAEIPMDKVKLKDETLTVEASAIGVHMTGPIDAVSKTWETTFKQGMVTSPITMKKVDKIPGKD